MASVEVRWIEGGGEAFKSRSVGEGLVVGTSDSGELWIDHNPSAKVWATILPAESGVVLEILDPGVTILLNGLPASRESRIKAGDLLEIGRYRIDIAEAGERTPPVSGPAFASAIPPPSSGQESTAADRPSAPAGKPEDKTEPGGVAPAALTQSPQAVSVPANAQEERTEPGFSQPPAGPADRTLILPSLKTSPEKTRILSTGAGSDKTLVLDKKIPPPPPPPALVGLSGALKGREIPIHQSPFSIGRSRDNTLGLEDDAASRNHAVIERSPKGVWVIRDLGSRNGTKVGGKKITEVTLKNKAVIEIGETRLRFTEYEPKKPFGRRRLLFAAAAVVILLIAAAVWLQGQKGQEPVHPGGKKGASAPAQPIDARASFEQGVSLMQKKEWAGAIAMFDKVLASDPNHTLARANRNRAEEEAKVSGIMKQFASIREQGKHEEAIKALEGVPETSAYAGDARRGRAEMSRALANRHLEQARAALAAKDFETAKKEVDAGLAMVPEDSEARALKAQIPKDEAEAARAARRTRKHPGAAAERAAPKEKAPPPSPEALAQAESFHRLASAGFDRGNYAEARDLWQKALRAVPGHPNARAGMTRLSGIAKKLYQEGYMMEAVDLPAAMAKWEEVLKVAPPEDSYYAKAQAKLQKYKR